MWKTIDQHRSLKVDLKKLRVNGKRLQSTLGQMAKIGGTPGGGVQRLTLSDEDKQARSFREVAQGDRLRDHH